MHTMILTLLFASLVLLPACDTTDSTVPGTEGVLKAVIDGVPWEANFLVAAVYDETETFSANGSNRDNQFEMNLDAVDVNGPGTYDLGASGAGATLTKHLQLEEFRTTESLNGQMVITVLTGQRAKGTFYFDAMLDGDSTRIVQVRDGEFDMGFVE